MSEAQKKTVNIGYKYRIYPSENQIQKLNHQFFVSNQTYNICNNLWLKELENNKHLEKEEKRYRSSVSYDTVVKRSLSMRRISISTVVTQQSRMNFLLAKAKALSKEAVSERQKAIAEAITPKQKAKAFKLGFPKFKSSKDPKQSFSWNNQAITLVDTDNKHFKTLRLMKENIDLRYHRSLPDTYKLCSATVSKEGSQFFVAFNIEYITDQGPVIAPETLDLAKVIGVDANVENFAVSAYAEPIKNDSRDRRSVRYSKILKVMERKQSRRAHLSKKTKIKLGANHKKDQARINRVTLHLRNQKEDLYHRLSFHLTKTFDLIAVEDLKLKNQMMKSAKGTIENPGKNIRQKSGLNRSLASASFYQFAAMLQYKSKLNDKLFVKVDPRYTSQTCICGHVDKENRKTQSEFLCTRCGHQENADMRASSNIRNRGLESLGLGISLQTINRKPFDIQLNRAV
jgi:putative transposase